MRESLDERYFHWLYSQIGSVKLKNAARTHWSLAGQLHKKEFIWLVPNDDNRVEDGRDLRYEFLDAYEIEGADPEWLDMGCSMLEMLVALARRLVFENEGDSRNWFWHLIEQMDLEYYNDRNCDAIAEKEIDEALDLVIWRRYSPNGQGGLFPLQHAKQDQRKVEIWYQLSSYLIEIGDL